MSSNSYANAVLDGFPISPAHSLIVPKRHVGSFFELGIDEKNALLQLLEEVKLSIDEQHKPDGYNIGINDGTAAGQTIPHLHIHLIPRYHGDVTDPRGGVRWVLPKNANYWSNAPDCKKESR